MDWGQHKMEAQRSIRALIVEDEPLARQTIKDFVQGEDWLKVVGEAADGDSAITLIDDLRPDLVFLDVRMPGLTGLQVLESIKHDPEVVFTTAYDDHAVTAFELEALDYILKPFTEERVDQCLRRLLDRRAPRAHAVRRVVARRKKSLVFLDPEKIWAFEAADRLTFVHSAEGKFDIDLSLAAIEASFGRALFRVHRNWLVNLAYVKELDRDIGGATVMVGSDLGSEGGGIRAPVSQDRAKALRDVLLENATGLRRS